MSTAEATVAHRRRANELCALRRFDEAQRLAAELVSDDPDDVGAWCILARARLGLQAPESARDAARAALGIRPEFNWPLRILAMAESRLGNHREAVAVAEQARRLAPDSWQTNILLAELLVDFEDRRADAEAAIERALELGPDQADVHAVAGKLEFVAGRPADAEQAYRRALAIAPDHAVAQNGLGRIAASRRTPESLGVAASRFADGAGVNPDNPVIARNIDQMTRVLLTRTALQIMIIAFIITVSTAAADVAAIRGALGLALLAGLPGGFLARFLRSASAPVRRRLRWMVTHAFAFPTAVHVSAVAVLLAALFGPRGLALSESTAAGILAFASTTIYSRAARRRGVVLPRTLRAADAQRVWRWIAILGLMIAASITLALTTAPVAGTIWTFVWGVCATGNTRSLVQMRRSARHQR